MDLEKLAKCLRMLTSDHDGEVVAAARRACGLLAAEDMDWSDVLGAARPELSQEQMKRIWDDGYAKGKEAGAVRPSGSLWQPAGREERSNGSAKGGRGSDQLGADGYKEVWEIISAARDHQEILSDFEDEFTESMAHRLGRYGRSAFVTTKQWAVIDRLSEKLTKRGVV